MHDYADDVHACVTQLERKPVVMGWSMGGLVAMMVASSGEALACVGLAPSTPTLELDASIEIRRGEFGPDEYGITSNDLEQQPAMPDLDIEERKIALASLGRESRRARDERKAGIVVESLPCPLLIVTGSNDRQWPTSHYDGFHLDAGYRAIDGASHWGLVLSRKAVADAVTTATDFVIKRTQGL
jgi:pimeloyl-ACP methyl ester carboxylesterase